MGVHAAYQVAGVAVEEASEQHVSAQESPEWFEHYGRHGGFAACMVCGLCGQEVVAAVAEGHFVDAVEGIVEQVAFEGGYRGTGAVVQFFVYGALPLCLACGPQAHFCVGVPAAVVYPASAEIVEPVELVHAAVVQSLLFQLRKCAAQGGGEGFVGVDAEGPWVG